MIPDNASEFWRSIWRILVYFGDDQYYITLQYNFWRGLSKNRKDREEQDSIAIAKKTARCAQYMGALKSFQSPHYAPGYFSRNL